MNLYLDASALVKLVLDEEDSEAARELWATARRTLTSVLSYPETRSALRRAERLGRLKPQEHRVAAHVLDGYFDQIVVVELRRELGHQAGVEADRTGLGGADAVHLTTARSIRGSLVFATWDRALARAAAAAGLVVAPA